MSQPSTPPETHPSHAQRPRGRRRVGGDEVAASVHTGQRDTGKARMFIRKQHIGLSRQRDAASIGRIVNRDRHGHPCKAGPHIKHHRRAYDRGKIGTRVAVHAPAARIWVEAHSGTVRRNCSMEPGGGQKCGSSATLRALCIHSDATYW